MRTLDAATLAHLSARDGIVAHRLVWISARNAQTQAVEALGIWSGDHDLDMTIDGEARTYIGLGALLEPEPIAAGTGLSVRVHRLRLSAVAPEVEDLVKGYHTRFAPVEIRRALFSPATRQVIGDPHRVFLGLVNAIEFPRAEPGGAPAVVVEVVSETRGLTRSLALKKSDDSQRARGDDRFRRYGDISGAVPVYWGELRADGVEDPAPAAVPPAVYEGY